jgi:hypothetical protein
MSKTTGEILAEIRNLDYGYCNPMKVKMADEDEHDLRAQLHERGLSDSEIDRLVGDAD